MDGNSGLEIDPGVGAVSPPLKSLLEKTIVPLMVLEGDRLIGIGSGTVVSSIGVVLTARHVIEEAQKPGIARSKSGDPSDWHLYALMRTGMPDPTDPSLEVGGLLHAIGVWADDNLDVAFVTLAQMVDQRTNEPLTYPAMPLLLSAPSPGDRILAFGYQGVTGAIEGNGCDYSDDLFASDGVIDEVFHEKRDSVMLKFPSFSLTGDFRGGMSGGPILLDVNFGVIGIVCSGSDAGYATGAMVWPSMGIPASFDNASFASVLEFADAGWMNIHEGRERVSVVNLGDGRHGVQFRRSSYSRLWFEHHAFGQARHDPPAGTSEP